MKANGFEMSTEEKRVIVQLIGLHNRKGLEREKQVEYKKWVDLMSDNEIEMIYERFKTIVVSISVNIKNESITLK